MTQHLRRQKVKPKEIEPLSSMFQAGYRPSTPWITDYWDSIYKHSFLGISLLSNPALPEGVIIMEMSPRKMEERLNTYLIKTKEACK